MTSEAILHHMIASRLSSFRSGRVKHVTQAFRAQVRESGHPGFIALFNALLAEKPEIGRRYAIEPIPQGDDSERPSIRRAAKSRIMTGEF